jgi:hypothetical protein
VSRKVFARLGTFLSATSPYRLPEINCKFIVHVAFSLLVVCSASTMQLLAPSKCHSIAGSEMQLLAVRPTAQFQLPGFERVGLL